MLGCIDKIKDAINSSSMIKLTLSNYSICKHRIKVILYFKELHKPHIRKTKPDSKTKDV